MRSLVEVTHRGYIVDHESEEGLKREVDIAAFLKVDINRAPGSLLVRYQKTGTGRQDYLVNGKFLSIVD